ncbi:2-oxo acid dehydrogenase subunit E2 [bacterium]|nr:2-oxo acid dehydrogenase subunit E2 [bacterium]
MVFEFRFPDIGEGVHEGKILQWSKKEGELVREGDILATVETDKVVAEIPSPKEGVLVKKGAFEGQIIHVGAIFAILDTQNSSDNSIEESKKPLKEENAGVVGELETSNGFVMPSSGEGILEHDIENISLTSRKSVLATPVARKMASDLSVDISKVKGTGPSGRVMKQDISDFLTTSKIKDKTDEKPNEFTNLDLKNREEKNSNKTHPQTPSLEGALINSEKNSKNFLTTDDYKVEKLSQLRKTIAKNMTESHNIPTALVQDFAIIDQIVAFRDRVNQNRDERISFQPIFMKALAATLRKFSIVNSNFHPEKEEIYIFSSINIGVAVDTQFGLMVPVIKNVESKSIIEINKEMKTLVEKAKNRTITLDEMRGGTITISNYGSFGGVYGKPMILPPQTAIIGFGRVHQTPVVQNGEIVPATILPISLPFDHRVIDGATAGSFLTEFIKTLSNIDYFLVHI